MTEPFSARCRRILENGPAAPEDYEAAGYLIDQGLGSGRYQASRSRETFGKVVKVIWLGITPAGRLWLEQQSARANFDKAEVMADIHANRRAEHLEQESLKSIAEAIAGLPKPQSNPVKIALGVFIGFLGLVVAYLFRTHLGIPL